ncbi:hypothetical protein J3F83DRAFT_551617 [Trichoderma novae-zelandiae]
MLGFRGLMLRGCMDVCVHVLCVLRGEAVPGCSVCQRRLDLPINQLGRVTKRQGALDLHGVTQHSPHVITPRNRNITCTWAHKLMKCLEKKRHENDSEPEGGGGKQCPSGHFVLGQRQGLWAEKSGGGREGFRTRAGETERHLEGRTPGEGKKRRKGIVW